MRHSLQFFYSGLFGTPEAGNKSLRMNGRGGAIRTPDPLRPRQVRYQAALRPDSTGLGFNRLLVRCEFRKDDGRTCQGNRIQTES